MANKAGYGKPPASTRFQKGRSGNPTGRSKGTRNLRSVLNEQMHDKVALVVNGRELRLPAIDAFVMSLKAGSIMGDPRQQSNLLRALKDAGLINAEDNVAKPLSRDEREILNNYQARILRQAEALGFFEPQPGDPKNSGMGPRTVEVADVGTVAGSPSKSEPPEEEVVSEVKFFRIGPCIVESTEDE